MKAPIHIIEKGTLVRLNKQAAIPDPAQPWNGFPIEFLAERARSFEQTCFYNPNPLIWYCKNGRGNHKLFSGAHSYTFDAFPGGVALMQERFEVDRQVSKVTDGEYLVLEVRPIELQQLFPDEVRKIDFSNIQISNDKVLQNLFCLMETEILSGCHSGRLYAESISIAFISYLTQHYAPTKPLKRLGNRLPEQSLKTIKSYIQDNLANELSIIELAGLLYLSPYHFARLFKATTGVAPHRYVMEQRLLEAQRLLKSGLSVTEVAHATGFASQAHLSDVFRRRFGVPPSSL